MSAVKGLLALMLENTKPGEQVVGVFVAADGTDPLRSPKGCTVADVWKLSADTPRVSRSHVLPAGQAVQMAGDLFEDGLSRVVVSMSVSAEVVAEANGEAAKQAQRDADARALLERVESVFGHRTVVPPRPATWSTVADVEQAIGVTLLPWQQEVVEAALNGKLPNLALARTRKSGRNILDRALAEVCPHCRTVSGHDPLCITRLEEQFARLRPEQANGSN